MITILVVDECPAVWQFVDLAVGADEVDVVGAADGLAALASVARTRPDLVLATTGLAGLGGCDLATRLLRRGIPVVLMIGGLDPSGADAGVAAAGVLAKPLQVEQLRDLVSQMSGERGATTVTAEVCDDDGGDGPQRTDAIDEWLGDADSSLGMVPARWRSLVAERGDLHSFAHDVAALRDGRVTVQPLRLTT
jgi:CheY-like chemotaxis protein